MIHRLYQLLLRSFSDIWYLVCPRSCPICSRAMTDGEDRVCTHCFVELQGTSYIDISSNPMEQKIQQLTGLDICAGALTAYNHNSVSAKLIACFKYKNMPSLALWSGELLGMELEQSKRFEGVDIIVPIPLHSKRLQSRGYNQAEFLSQGIVKHLNGSKVVNALSRIEASSTQTRLGKLERWDNTKNIFSLCDPISIKDKHIILVDDVFTTGATLCSAVKVLLQGSPQRISVVSFAAGGV